MTILITGGTKGIGLARFGRSYDLLDRAFQAVSRGHFFVR